MLIFTTCFSAKNNQTKGYKEPGSESNVNDSVEVRSVRTRSRGASIDKDRSGKSKKTSKNNAPTPPNTPHGAVYSSELSRSDIEEIRQLTRFVCDHCVNMYYKVVE